jgi:capsule polysaccharide export protein KpsE/RkpR
MKSASKQLTKKQPKAATPQVQFGGGGSSPQVRAHFAKMNAQTQQTPKPKVQMGGGGSSPQVKAHFAKQNRLGLVVKSLSNH